MARELCGRCTLHVRDSKAVWLVVFHASSGGGAGYFSTIVVTDGGMPDVVDVVETMIPNYDLDFVEQVARLTDVAPGHHYLGTMDIEHA